MKSPKTVVFCAVCALSTHAAFAEQTLMLAEFSPVATSYLVDQPGVYGVNATLQSEQDMTLATLLQWTGVSYPTADRIYVRDNLSLQIGSQVYND